MGVNTPGYLISPKIIAGVTMIPLLVIVSVVLGLTGGYIACVVSRDIAPTDFIVGLQNGFNPVIVTVCAVKSVAFGFIITSVCSYFGFYTTGGALEVGQSATKGVVFSCIWILFGDLVISSLLL
jgi:phospholipid/cholesterol/gamma-HCH transport system permease protein